MIVGGRGGEYTHPMRAITLCLTFVVSSAAVAQTPPPTPTPAPKKIIEFIKENPAPQTPTIDPAHQATPEQVREYFAVIHLGDTMKVSMSQVISAMKTTSAPYIPASFWQDMQASMADYDFISELIPIYQEHLTRDDLEAVLIFYRSDAGKHLLANQATMSAEAQVTFRMIGRKMGEQIGLRHANEIAAAKKKYEEGLANKQMLNMNPDPQ